MIAEDDKPQIVQLDVGGTLYKVSRETLEFYEGSMLASLVSDYWKEDGSHNEPIFIDQNGRLFEYVLDYVRTNMVFLPRSVSQMALEKEFEYYGIDADMIHVNDLYGFEHLRMIKEEIGVQEAHLEKLKREALAIQLSMFTELEYLKTIPCKTETVKVDLPQGYENYNVRLFKECLIARGLAYVPGTFSGASFEIVKLGGEEDTDSQEDDRSAEH